jgi:serine/threonine protein kinase
MPMMFRRARPLVEADFENSGKVGEGKFVFEAKISQCTENDNCVAGTYGVVDRALEKKNRRVVAIKEFKETKEGEGISQTAIREIALLRELQHTNIVSLRSVYVDPTRRSLRLVYDYAEYDLYEIVRFHRALKKPIPDAMVLSIMFQLVNGVHFLHSNWIVHRDLKPSNVLVMGTVHNAANELGTVKIADFGLARSLLNPLRPLHTVVVTIWYRPPELLLGARNYSAAIDMWAVGAILGELLALNAMFQGEQNAKSNQFEEHQLRCIYQRSARPTSTRGPRPRSCSTGPTSHSGDYASRRCTSFSPTPAVRPRQADVRPDAQVSRLQSGHATQGEQCAAARVLYERRAAATQHLW